jgi:hypothetical protein
MTTNPIMLDQRSASQATRKFSDSSGGAPSKPSASSIISVCRPGPTSTASKGTILLPSATTPQFDVILKKKFRGLDSS